MPFYSDPTYCRTVNHSTLTISREGISLPTYIGLADEDIAYISIALINAFEKVIV